MKRTETALQSVEVLQSVVCNKCGESCSNINPGGDRFEFATLSTDWGYGSGRDGEREESHLCEKCYAEVVSCFKVKPTVPREEGNLVG
jgi:hypothetical protein